jgi:anti-sigma-K factor RskA
VSPRDTTPRSGHLDPELLALLALGETPGTGDDFIGAQRHLETCAVCLADLAGLTAVAATARTVTPDDALVEPPAAVWSAISAELEGPAPSLPPHVAPMTSRRRTSWVAVAAAACVGLVVGSGVMYAATSGQRATVAQTVVAEASLAPLPGSQATGNVEVVSTASGAQVLVDVSGLAKPDGFYEVWLLDRKGEKLIALGVLDGSDKGTFAMPPGVAMSDYPVVDVSLEPSDGNPGHSHHSLVRGTLPA